MNHNLKQIKPSCSKYWISTLCDQSLSLEHNYVSCLSLLRDVGQGGAHCQTGVVLMKQTHKVLMTN